MAQTLAEPRVRLTEQQLISRVRAGEPAAQRELYDAPNRDPQIRKKAMFWLGQSNDPRAIELFEEILARK